jgi:O-antigen ligase
VPAWAPGTAKLSRVLVVVGGAVLAALLAALLVVDVKIGLLALGALVIAPLAFYRIQIAICIWIVMLFFSSLSGFTAVPNRLLTLVLICWLGLLANRRVRLHKPTGESRVLILLVLVFVIWEIFTLAWAPVPHVADGEVRDLIYSLLVVFLVINTTTEPKYARWYATAFVLGATLTVMYGAAKGGLTAGGATSVTDAEGRLIAGQGDPNYLAAVLVPALVLAGALAVGATRVKRACLTVAVLIIAVGIAATQSRGGLVAAGIMALAALVIWRGRRLAILAVILVATVGTVGFVLTSSSALSRIETGNQGSGRTDVWQIAWRIVHTHPLFGVGLAQFPEVSPQYTRQPGALDYVNLIVEKQIVVHNLYLQLWAETGAVGLLMLIVLLVVSMAGGMHAIRSFERQRDPQMLALARSALLALLGILAANFFLSDITNRQLWFLVAFCGGLASLAERRQQTHAPHVTVHDLSLGARDPTFEELLIGSSIAT